jgi:hypothetical protein
MTLPAWRDVKSQIKPNKARQKLERAYHEGGHGVIARKLGIRVNHVTIVDDGAGNAGVAQTGNATHLARDADQASQLTAISKDAIVSLAGPLAQHRYRPQTISSPEEWDSDRKLASTLAIRAALIQSGVDISSLPPDGEIKPDDNQIALRNEFFERSLIESKKLVNENWRAIDAVAKALVTRLTLNQDELDELIKEASEK